MHYKKRLKYRLKYLHLADLRYVTTELPQGEKLLATGMFRNNIVLFRFINEYDSEVLFSNLRK